MENIYYPIDSEIIKIKDETPTIKTFTIKMSEPLEFRAGQFVQLTYPGVGEAPFTPSSKPGKTDSIEITILRTGRVTDALHYQAKVGDPVGIRGPFGKGYPLDKFAGAEILVVGGGVGLAPLRSCLYSLFDMTDKVKRIVVKYGARTPNDLCFRDEYEKWRKIPKVELEITIDTPYPGWTGKTGVVTVLLNNLDLDRNNTYVVSCGPEIMLKFVTQKLIEEGFKEDRIYLSMNRRMSCGLGKCARCNIGPYYLCKDGPDMNYAKIKDYPNVFGG